MIKKICIGIFTALIMMGCAAKNPIRPIPTRIRFGEKIMSINSLSDRKDPKQRVQYAFSLFEEGYFLESASEFIKISEEFSSPDHRFEYECCLAAAAIYLRVGNLRATKEAMDRARGFYNGHVRTTRENGLLYIHQLLKSETKNETKIEVPMRLKNFLK